MGIRKSSALLASFPLQYMTLSLGLYSLANLLHYAGWSGFFLVAGIVYLLTLVSMVGRTLDWPEIFWEDISQPNDLATYATGLLASYFFARQLGNLSLDLGQVTWWLAFLANVALLGQFIRIQVRRRKNLRYMTPIWYLIFVSICAAAKNGYELGLDRLPYLILFFAFANYLLITPVLVRRLLFGPPFDRVQEPAKALMCATPSLILLSFLTLFPDLPMAFALVLLVVSQAFLLWLYRLMVRSFRQASFIPGYASFTFALGTSCLDLAHFRDHYLFENTPLFDAVTFLARVEMALATGIIAYLLVRFLFFTLSYLSSRRTHE